jgi:hypothetical protein
LAISVVAVAGWRAGDKLESGIEPEIRLPLRIEIVQKEEVAMA